MMNDQERLHDDAPTVAMPRPADAVDEAADTRAMPAVGAAAETVAAAETEATGVNGANDGTALAENVVATESAVMPEHATTPPPQEPPVVPLYATRQPDSGPVGGPDPRTPMHQVPRDEPADPAVIRRTGPSAATIVLGVILTLVGAAILAFAMRFPWWLPAFDVDWRVAAALTCGVLGVLFILVAVIWSVAGLLRRRKED